MSPAPRTAVITGAGSGLGRATAIRFAAEGCRLLLIGRRQQALLETVAMIERESLNGQRCTIAPLDVADAGAMEEAVDQFAATHDHVDALVANAGINPQRTAALDTGDEHWDETIRVNLTGVHRSVTAVLPYMMEEESGAIVTLGSIAGQAAMKERASYGPTKAAVILYTKNLAVDYAKYNIRANALCPGFVITDICREWVEGLSREQRKELEASHPLGLGKPEDIANAAWFLCGPDSRWISGVDLSVDGGYRA
ncbi:MAG: SDR family oxidoreductase [Planctomycetes bacterium]|nr:SDR family oxidoreductase [Planctomycetota bacterium]MCP4772020.1 SDR family oxidoreductase [Planctomycetota bacterium]MCP4860240.1 SDR family oxidoreductase [Planctomycetota bacterium]